MNQSLCRRVIAAGLCGALAAAMLDAKSSGRPQEPPAQVEMAVRCLLRGSGYERLADDPEFRKALREWLAKDLAAQDRASSGSESQRLDEARRLAELKWQEEEAERVRETRSREEKAKPPEEARKQDEDARKHAEAETKRLEEARKREEAVKQQQAEARKQEDAKRREEEARKKEEEARRREAETKRLEEAKKQKEAERAQDEARKRKEAKEQAEAAQRQTAETEANTRSPDEKFTGDEIMRQQKARHESAVERERIVMVLIDARNNQEKRNLKRWSKRSPDGLFNYLIYFEGPANVRGVVLLTRQKEKHDDEQWQYLPAAGAKMRRIAGGNRRSAFMGTDFAFEDLRSEKLEAHSYTLLREEKLEGETCYVIEAAAVSPEEKETTGYSRRVFWIRKDHLTTMKTEYYDRSGRLLKTATSYEIKSVKGDMMRPDKVLMEHHQDNHKTLMGTVERDVIAPIDDNVFTERGALDFK